MRWPTLEDYFATFSSRRRREFRRNRRRFLAHEPAVRVHGPDGLTPDLVELQLEQYVRHGHAAGAADVRDRFARAARVPGLKVLRADAGGRPLGFVAFYESPKARRIVTRLGSCVYGRPECYFNISYYELIAHAARAGRMRIHYGDTTYAAKVARGCRLSRLTTFLRAADPSVHSVLSQAARLRTRLEDRRLTPLESSSGSDQVAGLPTAPQGNVTQASHRYLANQRLSAPNVTTAVKSGEADEP